MAEIIYTIDKQGNITEEVKGVLGQACTKLTQKMENALGNVKEINKTGEYFKKAEVEIVNHIRA